MDDGSSLGVTDDQVAEVQSIIDGDSTEENPGYRSAGVNVLVRKPAIQTQAVTATLTVLGGVDTDQVNTDTIDALTQYINTLGVGEDIIYNELVSSIMGVYGITNCDITVPSADVTVAQTQVGRIGTITLAQV